LYVRAQKRQWPDISHFALTRQCAFFTADEIAEQTQAVVEEGRFYTFLHAVALDPLSLRAKAAKDGMTAFDASSVGRLEVAKGGGAMIEAMRITLSDLSFDALAAGPEGGGPVLLLHGWPEFADCWRPIMQALAGAGYRAVAVDQRGYSPSARPLDVTDYAMNRLVADALGFADQLGWTTFHLVAHDWGGMVAWTLAGAHPDRLRSLSVLATPHPVALSTEAAADEVQYHRLDYIRFFRQPGGVAEAALFADRAARLRGAYGGNIPPALVDANVERLSRPGALTATLNWYRAVTEAGRAGGPHRDVNPLYLGRSRRRAGRGRRAAHRRLCRCDLSLLYPKWQESLVARTGSRRDRSAAP
jgi:pimeloyl-ACP methyl ester carboxylesterase